MLRQVSFRREGCTFHEEDIERVHRVDRGRIRPIDPVGGGEEVEGW